MDHDGGMKDIMEDDYCESITHAYYGFLTEDEAEGYVFSQAEWFGKSFNVEEWDIETDVYEENRYDDEPIRWVGVFKAERKPE